MLDGVCFAVTDEQERRLLALDAAGARHFAGTVEEAPRDFYADVAKAARAVVFTAV